MKYAIEFTDVETGTREIYGDIPKVFNCKGDADAWVRHFPEAADAMVVPVGPALQGKIDAIIARKV